MEELTLITPTFLFSAISLLMLAYTNRFLSYAQLVRNLKDKYMEDKSAITKAQILNLRKRLYLTRNMQLFGVGSLMLSVVTMFLIYRHDNDKAVVHTTGFSDHFAQSDSCRDTHFSQVARNLSERYAACKRTCGHC